MILMPLYWQQIRGESVVDTGLLTAPMGLGMAVIMPLAGRLTDRLGGGPLALFGVIADHGRDGPVRLHRRAHLDPLAVARDGRPRDGRRLRLHAGDVGGVRVAQALGALRRHPAAERAAARRRLDRHGPARRRAAALAPAARTRWARRQPATGRRSGGRPASRRWRSCPASSSSAPSASARRARTAAPAPVLAEALAEAVA